MRLLIILCSLAVASLSWAKNPVVSLPLAFQINASATNGTGENLARLVAPDNTEGVAVGPWMEFVFNKPMAITKMTVVNGWAAHGWFNQHGRIKTVELTFNDGGKQAVTFKDTDKPQALPIKGTGMAMRMTVTSVYPGTISSAPYISRIGFEGYDPNEQQVTLIGRYEGCVHSRSSSSWGGQEEPFFYCARFHTDDGAYYGCVDDLCFHSKEMVNARLKVIGVIKPGNVLEVLEATPVK